MICLIKRVLQASVKTKTLPEKNIGQGLVVYVGISVDDTIEDVNYCVKKVLNLRIFEDDLGIMNLSVTDTKGSILVISNFTLQANTLKGNRPSYINAANHEFAYPLYQAFVNKLKSTLETEEGYFKEEMIVSEENIGPVSIIINSKERKNEKNSKS